MHPPESRHSNDSQSSNNDPGRSIFPTTRWSLILDLRSGKTDSDKQRERALQVLCEDYWYPIYVYVRRRGHSPAETEDLTQDFFYELIRGEVFEKADSNRGKLRSFLMGTLSNFLSAEWRKRNRLKRGGGETPISLDAERAEERYASEPVDTVSPEKLFDRRWALLTIDSVYSQLEKEFHARGKERYFALLKGCLTPGASTVPYNEIAVQLETTEDAIKQAVRRLRQRFGELMRERVAFTVERDQDIEEEIRSLFAAFQ